MTQISYQKLARFCRLTKALEDEYPQNDHQWGRLKQCMPDIRREIRECEFERGASRIGRYVQHSST
jgi:hypothetical protein